MQSLSVYLLSRVNLLFRLRYVWCTLAGLEVSASLEGSDYRGINIVGLIGVPGCPVKITLVIIYAKDDTPLAGCHKTVLYICF